MISSVVSSVLSSVVTAAFEWLVRYLLRTSQERLEQVEGPRRRARDHVLVHGLKPLATAYTEVGQSVTLRTHTGGLTETHTAVAPGHRRPSYAGNVSAIVMACTCSRVFCSVCVTVRCQLATVRRNFFSSLSVYLSYGELRLV